MATGLQPWPSGNAIDSDQCGPGFKAHRRPLVTSGRASGLKCSCQINVLLEAPSKPKGIGENGGKIE